MSDLKRLKFQPDSSRLVCLIMVGTQVQFHKIPKIGFTSQILSDITHGNNHVVVCILTLQGYYENMNVLLHCTTIYCESTANLLRIYCAWRYSMDLHVLISTFP